MDYDLAFYLTAVFLTVVFWGIVGLSKIKRTNDPLEELYFRLVEKGCCKCGGNFIIDSSDDEFLSIHCCECEEKYRISPELQWAEEVKQ